MAAPAKRSGFVFALAAGMLMQLAAAGDEAEEQEQWWGFEILRGRGEKSGRN